jgi:hypothetical protein
MTADDLRQTVIDTALRIAERLGVPVLVLAVLLWCAREAAISLSQTVLEPIVQSHVEFLDTTRETLREIGHTQAQQAQTLQEIAHGQREIQQVLARPANTQGAN